MWQRVSRTDRMTDASPHITWVFSSSYKLQQTLPVTTLLLFGPVTLLCGSLLFHLKTEGSVQLSDCEHHQTDSSLIHTASFSMHTDTLTLWLWYYLWRRIRAAELPPYTSVTFTQTAIRRIGAWIPEGQCEWSYWQIVEASFRRRKWLRRTWKEEVQTLTASYCLPSAPMATLTSPISPCFSSHQQLPLSQRVATLSPQQRFANPPQLVIHTEPGRGA